MATPLPLSYLTRRQLEILKLYRTGLKSTAIAHQLFISPLTVRKHRENIAAKLGVNSIYIATHMLGDIDE